MENIKNRTYYNLSNEEQNHYLKNKKEYTRFIIRITTELIPIMKKIIKDFDTCNKSDNAQLRDKTELYDFDVMDYDNSNARDMVANIAVVVCNKKDKDKLIKLFEKSFGDKISFKGARGGKSITTQIGTPEKIRGIWKPKDKKELEIIYPICILSLGRANDKTGYTHKLLCEMKIKHNIFVEPKEYDIYSDWINHDYCNIIQGKKNYSIEDKMGGTPMRNYILNWAKNNDYPFVWMLDDNIKSYTRYYQGDKNKIYSKQIFTSIESYIHRYNNVGIVSHNFAPLICEGDARTCLVKNGKCYSSLLIRTDTDIYFNAKYNEDVLISIEFICKGYCNICFNHVQYNKDTSGTNKGGNQTIYKEHTQQGYKDKYDYLVSKLNLLKQTGKLKLKENIELDQFIRNDTTMQSKEWHHKIDYSLLLGANNELEEIDYDFDYPKELIFLPNAK